MELEFLYQIFFIHGTLKFDLNSLSHNKFKLGVAQVNKERLCTRLQNQLWDGTFMTCKNNFNYTRVTSYGGHWITSGPSHGPDCNKILTLLIKTKIIAYRRQTISQLLHILLDLNILDNTNSRY